MKLGFFLGVIIGSAIAALLQAEPVEAPDDAVLLTTPSSGTTPTDPQQVANALKSQLQEAREAARIAALEKEAEMLLEYERTIHRKPNNS